MSTVHKAKKCFTEKELSKKKEEWRTEQKKRKEVFLTALTTTINKDLTTSIRKDANEL